MAGLAGAGIGVITLPAANLFLQGRDASQLGWSRRPRERRFLASERIPFGQKPTRLRVAYERRITATWPDLRRATWRQTPMTAGYALRCDV
jgi:hypothetical protein